MRVRAQRGFTLIEMMVGITLGLIVLASVSTVFVNVSSNRRDMERTGRQIENGRFAVQLLADDIVNAGYFGEFDPRDVGPPTTRPDPCSTSAADMKNMVLMHVQGYPAGATLPSCISDVRTGTAVIAIRRTATCIAGDTNCDNGCRQPDLLSVDAVQHRARERAGSVDLCCAAMREFGVGAVHAAQARLRDSGDLAGLCDAHLLHRQQQQSRGRCSHAQARGPWREW
jgi:prepilin-type N-terminal cleavage/methylation domain-containing protein